MNSNPVCHHTCMHLTECHNDLHNWASRSESFSWCGSIYKLDAESRELRNLESREPDVASRGFLNPVVPDDECV